MSPVAACPSTAGVVSGETRSTCAPAAMQCGQAALRHVPPPTTTTVRRSSRRPAGYRWCVGIGPVTAAGYGSDGGIRSTVGPLTVRAPSQLAGSVAQAKMGPMSLDRPIAEDPYAKLPPSRSFTVTSTDVTDGQPLKDAQVADRGQHLSAAVLERCPEGTKSFVVTCFDPDAPTPSGFWHWVAVDLPADVTELATGAARRTDLPGDAFHCRNDGGEHGFTGAAPPPGDHVHRYYFVVHAVGEDKLGVDENASPAVVSFNLAFKTLAARTSIGTYQH